MSSPASHRVGRWIDGLRGRGGTTRGVERYRRALWTTLASGVAKCGGFIAMLVLVPVLLRHFGEERLGIWMTLSSLTILIGFADLGMGTGLMTIVAKAEGAKDLDASRQAISSCFYVLAALAGVLILAFLLVNPLVPWDAAFRASEAVSRAELASAMAAFVTATLAGLPFSIVERVQSGQQEGFTSQAWQGGGTILSLGAVLVAVKAGAGLPGVLLAGIGVRSVMLAANSAWYFLVFRPELCPRISWSSRVAASQMMRLGVVFLWLNVLAFNWWLVDPIIITRTLGPDAVAGYGAMQRLFAVALASQYLVTPLWPAFGESLARGDFGWARGALKRSLAISIFLTAGMSASLVVLGRPLTRFWLGSDFQPSFGLLTGMAALNVLLIVAWNLSGVLIHGTYLRRQAGLYTAAAALALVLKIWLVRRWGLPGVVWASVLAFGFVYAPMASRLAWDAVRDRGGSGRANPAAG